jgi:hypothetical protein
MSISFRQGRISSLSHDIAGLQRRIGEKLRISEQINQRRLYVRKDGTGVFPEQIFLRARRDPAFFEVIDRERIRSLLTKRRRAVKG